MMEYRIHLRIAGTRMNTLVATADTVIYAGAVTALELGGVTVPVTTTAGLLL